MHLATPNIARYSVVASIRTTMLCSFINICSLSHEAVVLSPSRALGQEATTTQICVCIILQHLTGLIQALQPQQAHRPLCVLDKVLCSFILSGSVSLTHSIEKTSGRTEEGLVRSRGMISYRGVSFSVTTLMIDSFYSKLLILITSMMGRSLAG
jgi:hypothetical protein